MKIKRAHYNFWVQKKAKVSWFDSSDIVRIDQLIPDADPKTDQHFTAHNLIALLKSYRRQKKDLLVELLRIAKNPGTIIQPQKRSSYALKWAKRLELERFIDQVCSDNGR